MDIIQILRQKLDSLEAGPHSNGLRAVLRHIEVAADHLLRGQKDDDEDAFTDAIYRTNQAFEGSIKETYRVLAGSDPDRKKPFEIEKYFEHNEVLRKRVLDQFTIYRQDWRNPSAHDYKLSFDDSEAFLAIISVCGFANVLIDQISQRLAFETQSSIATTTLPPESATTLLDTITAAVVSFVAGFSAVSDTTMPHETEIIGSLHGFLRKSFPGVKILVEQELNHLGITPDVLVERDADDRLIIEVKRVRQNQDAILQSGIDKVLSFMAYTGICNSLLLLFPIPVVPEQLLDTKNTSFDGVINIIGAR